MDEIGYYREDFPVLGDWEFNLRFLEKYDIFVIPEELAYNHHRVEIKEGAYSNTIRGEFDKHIFYNVFLRNELLRKDMQNNTTGIGYLVNIAQSFKNLQNQVNSTQTALNSILDTTNSIHTTTNFIEGIFNIIRNKKWLKGLLKLFLR